MARRLGGSEARRLGGIEGLRLGRGYSMVASVAPELPVCKHREINEIPLVL